MGGATQNWNVALGVLSTVSSLGVAAFASFLPPIAISGISFLAAVCLALMARFNLNRKVADIWNGWRHLNTALMKFKTVEAFTAENLIDAYYEAERMLGNATYDLHSPTTKPNAPEPEH